MSGVCVRGECCMCACVYTCACTMEVSYNLLSHPTLTFREGLLTEPRPAHWIVMENPPASASYTRITGTVATSGSYMDFIN